MRQRTGLLATARYAGTTSGYRLTGEAIWFARSYDCKQSWIDQFAGEEKAYNLKRAVPKQQRKRLTMTLPSLEAMTITPDQPPDPAKRINVLAAQMMPESLLDPASQRAKAKDAIEWARRLLRGT